MQGRGTRSRNRFSKRDSRYTPPWGLGNAGSCANCAGFAENGAQKRSCSPSLRPGNERGCSSLPHREARRRITASYLIAGEAAAEDLPAGGRQNSAAAAWFSSLCCAVAIPVPWRPSTQPSFGQQLRAGKGERVRSLTSRDLPSTPGWPERVMKPPARSSKSPQP